MNTNMKPVSLKCAEISNFRSIIHSGKFHLPESLTVLIGQNESGKTSVIDALEAFSKRRLDNEDRDDKRKPTTITCTFSFVKEFLASIFKDNSETLSFLERFVVHGALDVVVQTTFLPGKKVGKRTILVPAFDDYPAESMVAGGTDQQIENESSNTDDDDVYDENDEAIEASTIQVLQAKPLLKVADVRSLLLANLPVFSVFRDDSLLPREILLSDLENLASKAAGAKGARNFLSVLDVDLQRVKEDISSVTEKQSLEETLNREFSADFNEFWTQQVVEGNKATVRVRLGNVPVATAQAAAGADQLTFTVETRGKHLFPDQRSQGFRWFLSFYLQMMVLKRAGNRQNVLLIDEPGAHLHIKAKKDVQKVLEEVKQRAQIVFTTHEPELIDLDQLSRIRVVSQVNNKGRYEGTKILSVEKAATDLGSTDALTLVYRAIGADVSYLKPSKTLNAILEEPSAYYYLSAWKDLLNMDLDVFFLPAIGADNVPHFVNILTGWGFPWRVILDDDDKGRAVSKRIVADWALSSEDQAMKIFRLRRGPTIEELFCSVDFQRFVLKAETENVDPDKAVGDLVRSGREGKALLARRFFGDVRSGAVRIADFQDETRSKFANVFDFLRESDKSS